MNLLSSRRPCTGRTSTEPGTAAGPYKVRDSQGMSDSTLDARARDSATRLVSDVFEKARTHDRAEQLEAAKQGDLLPYFRILESQAGPVVEMEGRETIMLGSNNYLGLTTDERVKQAARDALEQYGTGVTGSRLLNGTTPTPRRAGARARRLDGHRGRDRLHDRLPVEPRRDQRDPRARRHRHLRFRRPRLDPRRVQALRRPPSALPPQPDGQAGDDAGAGRRRRQRHPRGGRRRLLHGGRRLRPAADRRALSSLRRAADGGRGARCRGPGQARSRCQRALRPGGRGRPAHGDLLEEPRLLRRLHRRLRGGDRVPADRLPLLHLQRVRRSGRRRRRARGAADHPLRGARADGAPARERRLSAAGLPRSGAEGRGAGDPAGRHGGHHPGGAGDRRRGLAGGPALEGALRGRRLHQRRAPPRGAARAARFCGPA